MPLSELFDTCIEGLKTMLPVSPCLCAFIFVEANNRIGLMNS